MQTKAELNEENAKLKLRVAELEGQVEAFKLVIANLPKEPQPLPYYPTNDQWFWNYPLVPGANPMPPFTIMNTNTE